MSLYRDIDVSPSTGKPFYLYRFVQGVNEWFYTSQLRARTYAGDSYLATAITHSEIEGGGADAPGAVTITLPTMTTLAAELQIGADSAPIDVTIFRGHRQAPTTPAAIFMGEIASIEVQDEVSTLQVTPLRAQFDAKIPRGLIQRMQCAWITYEAGTCNVNPATFTFAGTVSAVSGLQVTVTGAAAFAPTDPSFFALGVLTFGGRKGMIEAQTGDVLTLLTGVPGMIVGSSVSLLAGDDRQPGTCRDKFNNVARYLAFPHMPTTSPFFGQGFRE